MAVMLSALRPSRRFIIKKLISVRRWPILRPQGLGKLIKIIHLIGSRNRDLPACSIVLQSLLPGKSPLAIWDWHFNVGCFVSDSSLACCRAEELQKSVSTDAVNVSLCANRRTSPVWRGQRGIRGGIYLFSWRIVCRDDSNWPPAFQR
jgi:hypothetical protein